MTDFAPLLSAISQRAERVRAYLLSDSRVPSFSLPHLRDAILSYPTAGGKALRPAVLMFACGAVGGEEQDALPAAAAVELYHTWTLVHDDIIDRDDKRRGKPTVHAEFRERIKAERGFDEARAAHYGLTIAILTGDLQQGWCTALLTNLTRERGLPADLTLNVIHDLFARVQNTLVDGEALDVMYAETPVEALSEAQVLDMLWKKTGVLYDFAGRAGAAIGLRQADLHHPTIERVAAFTGRCGTAFQLQDDVLGVIGNEHQLGKAVGADIREGKRTVIVLHALPKLSAAERAFALSVLGNQTAEEAQIQEVIGLLIQAGGIDHARRLAQTYVETSLEGLAKLPDSPAKALLRDWGLYLIERQL